MKNSALAFVLASAGILQPVGVLCGNSVDVNVNQGQNARELITLGDEIQKLEEASLALDSSLAVGSSILDPSISYTQTDPNRPKILDNLPDAPNGLRLYRLIIPKGGDLNVKLKSESSRIVMTFLMRLQSNAMAAGIRRANMPPVSVRRSRIGLQNKTEFSQEVVLMLKGPVGVGFSMEIERSWLKK